MTFSVIMHAIHQAWNAFVMMMASVTALLFTFLTFPQDKDMEHRLLLYQLDFRQGYIHQKIGPRSSPDINATWQSWIYQMGRPVCSGSGSDFYEMKFEAVVFTPDEWTGSDCNLVPGEFYNGVGHWCWRGNEVNFLCIHGEFTFQYDRPTNEKT